MPEFELVIPAYNEAKTVENLIRRAQKAALEYGYSSSDFQLVVVENGSSDDSRQVLDNLAQTDLAEWFRIVGVDQNQGYGYGIWSGLKTAESKYVGWTHADLQCDPVDAFEALKKVKESPEKEIMVKGVRSGRNWKDIFVSRVFESFARVLLGLKSYEINAQPKIMPQSLVSHFHNPPTTFAFDLYALYQAKKQNYKVDIVHVEFPPREHGVSKWASTFFGRYKTILGMIAYMWRLARREGRL
jgi:glycosyltransferase involved in cell wall biosynthesis